MIVYLVQLLLRENCEVVAITSTIEKALEAMNANFERTTDRKPFFVSDKVAKRHGRDMHFYDLMALKHTTTDDGFIEEFFSKEYAIAECMVDDPYWFGKEA